jgi:peptidyl-prolyl cis-trans isomerase A (cyclophilin A)
MRIWVYLLAILSVVPYVRAANPRVTLQISGAVSGTIVLEIYADQAPVTAANFINYVQSGFYNGLTFHRVIPGFMIQGGGFDTNLVQKATGPAIINESSNRLSNLRGTIAMARTTYTDSATSQFFINVADNPDLDYGYIVSVPNAYTLQWVSTAQIGYCVFGRVISGMNVVDAIAAVPTETVSTPQGSMANVPVNDVIIQSATVTLQGPVCADKLAGDANGDCRVDLADLALMAQNWMECNSMTSTCH